MTLIHTIDISRIALPTKHNILLDYGSPCESRSILRLAYVGLYFEYSLTYLVDIRPLTYSLDFPKELSGGVAST